MSQTPPSAPGKMKAHEWLIAQMNHSHMGGISLPVLGQIAAEVFIPKEHRAAVTQSWTAVCLKRHYPQSMTKRVFDAINAEDPGTATAPAASVANPHDDEQHGFPGYKTPERHDQVAFGHLTRPPMAEGIAGRD